MRLRCFSISHATKVLLHRYTAFGALLSEDGPWASDTVSYTYDNGRRRNGLNVQQPNASGWIQSYTHDAMGRFARSTWQRRFQSPHPHPDPRRRSLWYFSKRRWNRRAPRPHRSLNPQLSTAYYYSDANGNVIALQWKRTARRTLPVRSLRQRTLHERPACRSQSLPLQFQ